MVNATLVAAAGDIAFSDTSTYFVSAVAGVAVVALILALVFRAQVLKASEGTDKMKEIARAIQAPMPLLRSAGTYQSEHGYNRVARVEACGSRPARPP